MFWLLNLVPYPTCFLDTSWSPVADTLHMHGLKKLRQRHSALSATIGRASNR